MKQKRGATRKEGKEMRESYLPEGELLYRAKNRELTSSYEGLEKAMREEILVEGLVRLCDSERVLQVDLGIASGLLFPEEALYCRPGEIRKDVALITRVGKPVVALIKRLEEQDGKIVAILSRREAQENCQKALFAERRPGDLLYAKVTHMEPFGAFLDVGCGVSALLPVDAISISRISHPRDRLSYGEKLPVVIKSMDRESGRISLSLRELLGTWEENAARFEAGQTVFGILRSVESYGAFVELSPNLAGLAELRGFSMEDLKGNLGGAVSVYIKSICPERMKVKLVLIDFCKGVRLTGEKTFFVDPTVTEHLSRWIYSPPGSQKTVESCFDDPC